MKCLIAPLLLIGILIGPTACSTFSFKREVSEKTIVKRSPTGNTYTYTSHHKIANLKERFKEHLVVEDPSGKVLFDGPLTTEADKAKVPKEYAEILKKLKGEAEKEIAEL